MAKISYTGKQFTITLPKDLVKDLGLDTEKEVIISKFPGKLILFVEKIKENSNG